MEESDPGLSTPGTDDEVAGSPNTPEQVAMARALEKRHAPKPPAGRSARVSKPGWPALRIIAGVFAARLAVLALAVLNGRG